jgi:hypothetical protein
MLGRDPSLLVGDLPWYTFFLGAPVLRKCSPEKASPFTIVVVLCGIGLGCVFSFALAVLGFIPRMGSLAWRALTRRSRRAVSRPDGHAGIGVRRGRHRMREAEQALAARLRLRVHVALELEQRAPVDLALEVDHGFERIQ